MKNPFLKNRESFRKHLQQHRKEIQNDLLNFQNVILSKTPLINEPQAFQNPIQDKWENPLKDTQQQNEEISKILEDQPSTKEKTTRKETENIKRVLGFHLELGKGQTRYLPIQPTQRRSSKKNMVNVRCTFTLTNTFVNVSDFEGKTVWKCSAGGIKGYKKSAPFTNYILGQKVGKEMKERKIEGIKLEVIGMSSSRQHLFQGFREANLKIVEIKWNPSIPHNGCKPKKARRL